MSEVEGFRILEHPSDAGIEAWGETTAGAFQQAARGLLSIIADPATVEPIESREIAVEGRDIENLLVRWLSEVLFLYDAQRFATARTEITELTTISLKAVLRGERVRPEKHVLRTDVKAVTYHQLRVEVKSGRCQVRVFLDI